MAVLPEINADPDALVVVDTNAMAWEPTGHEGVSRKVLERVNDEEKGRETALYRFEPGAALPAETLARRMEFFVLEGRLSDGLDSYGQYTFVMNPPDTQVTLSSDEGAMCYLKLRNPFRETFQRMVVDTAKVDWLPFGHRAAKVVHFYRDPHGIETNRFGEVFPDQQIPSHDHAMGEETFIVDGRIMDERSTYEKGTWFRFPIGLPHAPYTKDASCKMYIREGDLVW